MNYKSTPECQAWIDQNHARYRQDHQVESPTYRDLVAKGHPLAEAYLAARAFFDSLSFAAETSARRFSLVGQYENATYGAPELDLSWWPHETLSDCCAFLHPGHVQWPRYVDTAAKAGWPEVAQAALRPGRWYIRTQNVELYKALAELGLGRNDMRFGGSFNGDGTRKFYLVDVTQSVLAERDKGADALQLHNAILALLREHHAGYILPQEGLAPRLVEPVAAV
jgi:hypothetical protein